MRKRIIRRPFICRFFNRDHLICEVQTNKKEIFLTFDDGPVPEVTPAVLDILTEREAKATFFCVGENIQRYPEVMDQIISDGHSVGNHTHHHLNGWSCSKTEFLTDVDKCQKVLEPYDNGKGKPLMRPPYGRLKPSQWRGLVDTYQVVMWDVLSGDFSSKIDEGTCLKKSIACTGSGSIVLFHDSVKTIDKLSTVLPEFLRHFDQLGYTFRSLN